MIRSVSLSVLLALFFLIAPPANATSGTVTVTSCASTGTGTDDCSFTWRYDAADCGSGDCDKLFIYFAGGQMTCPDPTASGTYLDEYTSRGYVAVCARLFTNSSSSDDYHFVDEADRVNELVQAITSNTNITSNWTGEYLLYSGVSHGATALTVAMARTNYEQDSSWKGSVFTGACVFDGTYDPPALLDFLHDNSCGNLNSVVSYQRAYERYCTWPGGWPNTSTCTTDASDKITAAGALSYAIYDWKMVECGSSMTTCSQDVYPAASISSTCSNIDGGLIRTCAYESFPNVSHADCGIDSNTIGVCGDWFEAQL